MKFKVGDVLIGCNLKMKTEYNGMECVVLLVAPGALAIGATTGRLVNSDYRVRWADGAISRQCEHELRKRPERGIPKEVREIFEQPINAGMVTT
jgi:hypothetical protein